MEFFVHVLVAILVVIGVASLWMVFEKAGEPGWKCFIPVYGYYILFKMATGNGWEVLFLFIPIVNIYYAFKLNIKLAYAFGRSTGFGIGLLFLPPIFYAILALGDAEYYGPAY